MAEIYTNSSVSATTINRGALIDLTWDGSADLGLYFYEGSIQRPDSSFDTISRRFVSANPLPVVDSYGNTSIKGTYTWTSRYADVTSAFNGAGLLGSYYSGLSFDTLVLRRLDSQIDFDWGTGSPDPVVPTDQFSVRWEGKISVPFSETYTFYTTSDDGVRLWVDGSLVVDNWTDHASEDNAGNITLSAGEHDFKLEYYENGGYSVIRLKVQSPSVGLQVVPASWFSVPMTYGVGFKDQVIQFTVLGDNQSTPVISGVTEAVPIPAGTPITLTASGGNGTGAYVWGGELSGTGTTKNITFDLPGDYTVTLYRQGDSAYNDSPTRTLVLTISQAMVSNPVFSTPPGTYAEDQTLGISCPTPGSTIRYTTDGSNPTTTHGTVFTAPFVVSAPTIVKAIAYKAQWYDSPVISGTFNVHPPGATITPLSSASPLTTSLNQVVELTWNGSATIGIAYYEGTIRKPDGSYVTVDRVWNPSFPAQQNFADTNQRGDYTWISRYADNSIWSPPLTGGTGYAEQEITFHISGSAQSAVLITPSVLQCHVGQTVNFTASGGDGTGEYVWFGAASGIGATKDVTFALPGTYEVKAYRNADLTYEQSDTTTFSMLVTAFPVEDPIFSVPGGTYPSTQFVSLSSATPGALIRYTTNGSTPSTLSGTLFTGAPIIVNGPTVIKVIAFKSGLPNSSVVTATYDIPPLPPVVTIDATVMQGIAPLKTTISWEALDATSVVVYGPNLSSAQAKGSKTYSNLDVGSYTFSIMAFNAGGSATATITVAALSSDVDFYIFGTKTVRFYDKTVYHADSWLWDFGDGYTSAEENPIHTYGYDGIFVVKLTAWCDGKESTIIHTVSVSGCFTDDPLPYTVEWDLLFNVEAYPPWDDPRFGPSEQSFNELGFVESAEGTENNNWEMCPYVDWCYGPETLGLPEFRFKTRWVTYLDPTTKIWSWGKGLPQTGVPPALFPEQVGNLSYFNNVNYVSLSFDADGKPYFAFQKGANQVQVRYYDSGGQQKVVTFTGETPKLFGEINIQPAADLADVCCFYLLAGSIYVRFQRENFAVAHKMQTPSTYGSELAVLTKVEDIRTNNVRRIYLYGYTIGHRKIVLRSGEYPLFPSDTPSSVAISELPATQGIVLDGGRHGFIADVQFSAILVGLEEGDHFLKEVTPPTEQVSLEGGSHSLPTTFFSSAQLNWEGGSHTPHLPGLTTSVTQLGSGAHQFIDGQFASAFQAFQSGAYVIRVDKTISTLSVENGSHRPIGDRFATSLLSVDNGTQRQLTFHSTGSTTFDYGSHYRRVEASLVRQTIQQLKSVKGDTGKVVFWSQLDAGSHTASSPHVIRTQVDTEKIEHLQADRQSGSLIYNLEAGKHNPAEWLAGHVALSIQSGKHLFSDFSASSMSTMALDHGTHRAQQEFISGAIAADKGTHASPDSSFAGNLIGLSSGVQYFQLFTFDYNGSDSTVLPEQDDRWDSTQRFFDLDVPMQPDIA